MRGGDDGVVYYALVGRAAKAYSSCSVCLSVCVCVCVSMSFTPISLQWLKLSTKICSVYNTTISSSTILLMPCCVVCSHFAGEHELRAL